MDKVSSSHGKRRVYEINQNLEQSIFLLHCSTMWRKKLTTHVQEEETNILKILIKVYSRKPWRVTMDEWQTGYDSDAEAIAF